MFGVFTPSQAKTATEERTAQDARRAKTMASITQELLVTQKEAEQAFEQTMRQQQEIAEKWFADNSVRRQELEREVLRFEERRAKALMPPLIKAEDIHSTSEALHARKLDLDYREEQVEEQSRLLMHKLDEVSTQKQDLDTREHRMKRLERGIETQRQQITQELKLLNQHLADFQSRKSEKEIEFAYKQSELDAQATLQKEREQSFIRREEEIIAAKRLLEDQRVLLDKGFEELRRKQKHGHTN